MPSVRNPLEKRRNRRKFRSQFIFQRQKCSVFLAAVEMVARKGAQNPKCQQSRLQQIKRKVQAAAGENRNETHRQSDYQYEVVQLVVAVTAVHKSAKQKKFTPRKDQLCLDSKFHAEAHISSRPLVAFQPSSNSALDASA